MKSVLGLENFVSDLAEHNNMGCESRVMNAVLGLTEFVCDFIKLN